MIVSSPALGKNSVIDSTVDEIGLWQPGIEEVMSRSVGGAPPIQCWLRTNGSFLVANLPISAARSD